NPEDCLGCGICAKACSLHAISIVDHQAVIGDRCKGCGRCVTVCPRQAISISVDGVSQLPQFLVDKFTQHTNFQ
ncbi:MAG TPA: 4Fe-4S binding protein, partial [Anaerolineaceae bacterium]|nr:4Fe-4S binding protein [Anaerolineaceae bacterium]